MINVQERYVRIFLFQHKENRIKEIANLGQEVVVSNCRNSKCCRVIRVIHWFTENAIATSITISICIDRDVCTKCHLRQIVAFYQQI